MTPGRPTTIKEAFSQAGQGRIAAAGGHRPLMKSAARFACDPR
jgi:hypothetical protein